MKIILFLFLSVSAFSQSLKEHISNILKDAPVPGPEGIKKKVPGTVSDVKLGLYGVYALLRFENSTRLIVYNISHGKFRKLITTKSPNYIVAASAELMYLYYIDSKDLEIWDLIEIKKIKEMKINLKEGFITNLAASPAVKSKLFFSSAKGGTEKGGRGSRYYGLLNLKNLETDFQKDNRYFNHTAQTNKVHLRVNNSFSDVIGWCTSYSSTGFSRFNFKSKTGHSISNAYYSLNFTHKDNLIVTTSGHVLNLSGQKLRFYKDSSLFPVLGGNYYIQASGADKSSINIRDLLSHSVLSSLNLPFKLKQYENEYRQSHFMTLDKFLVASKLSNSLFAVDRKNSYVYTFNLGIKKVENNGPPIAELGKNWEYKLNVPPGTNLRLEAAPDGVKLEGITLKWPSPQKKGVYDLLLYLKNLDGEESYKDIQIKVE